METINPKPYGEGGDSARTSFKPLILIKPLQKHFCYHIIPLLSELVSKGFFCIIKYT